MVAIAVLLIVIPFFLAGLIEKRKDFLAFIYRIILSLSVASGFLMLVYFSIKIILRAHQ